MTRWYRISFVIGTVLTDDPSIEARDREEWGRPPSREIREKLRDGVAMYADECKR
jgi:hypothetical protein